MSFFGKLFSDKDKENNESEYLDRVYESLGDESDLDPDRILDENSAADPMSAYDEIEFMTDNEELPSDAAERSVGGFGVSEIPDIVQDAENEALEITLEPEKGALEYETEPEAEFEPPEYEPEPLTAEYADEESIPDKRYADDALDAEEYGFGADTEETEPEEMLRASEDGAAEPENDSPGSEDVFDEKDAYAAFEDDKGDTDEMDVDQLINAMKEADGYVESEPEYETVSDAADRMPVSVDDPSYALLSGDIDTEEVYTAYAPKSMRPKVTETSYYDLDDMEDLDPEPEKESRFKNFVTKNKKWIIGAAVAAAVVLTTVGALFFARWRMNPLMGYTELYVTKGNIIKTMEAGGNVEPNARYNIIPPVSGTIIESPLNAGDTVRAGELVYKIDDTNAQIAVQQAQNAVSRAQQEPTGSTTSSGRVNIYANSSGTIRGLNISSGSRINGGQIATITQANGTEIGLIPSVTGTVERVNVSNGSTVSSGQVVAVVAADSASSAGANTRENDITAANLALEQAQKDLEKYKIAAPIDGTILVKNAKVGESVAEGASDQPMMVIADMSKMKLKIDVDELDIWNIELGQTVVITVSALPGETFSGEITNIAGEGEKKGDGVTSYAVEITVNDPGKIKSGMNVDAKIIIDSAINVLSLPESALYESDGENALVITDGGEDGEVVDPADYPDITVPSGYRLVKVKYGVSDGDNVEIISGLSVGDAVLHKASEEGESESETKPADNKKPAAPDDADDRDDDAVAPEEDSENLESTGKAATGVMDI